jgi:hypothetical protein
VAKKMKVVKCAIWKSFEIDKLNKILGVPKTKTIVDIWEGRGFDEGLAEITFITANKKDLVE